MSKRRKLSPARATPTERILASLPKAARTGARAPPSSASVRKAKGRLPDPTGAPVGFLTSIAQIGAVDDALYAPGGVLSRIARFEAREAHIEEVKRAGQDGLTIRQAMLDLGAREFGMKPLVLTQKLPRAMSPPTGPAESVRAFWNEVRHLLEQEHALVLAEPDLLSITELLLTRTSPGQASEDSPRLIVGFVPGEYALLARKTPALREALGLQKDVEKWEKGVAYEFLPDRDEPTLRTVSMPESPELADQLFDWLLLEALHKRLVVPEEAFPFDGRKAVITDDRASS